MSALATIRAKLPELVAEVERSIGRIGLADTVSAYIDADLSVRMHITNSLAGTDHATASRLIVGASLSFESEAIGISPTQQGAIAHLVAHRNILNGKWGARRAG